MSSLTARSRTSSVMPRLLVAVAMALLGGGLSVAVATDVAQKQADIRLHEDLAVRAGSIGATLQRVGSLVAGASAHFSQVMDDPAAVTDDDLRVYLDAVGGDGRYPELAEGLDYIIRAPRDELQSLQTARRRSMPGFTIDGGSVQVYQAVLWGRSSGGGHGRLADTDPDRSTALDDAEAAGEVRLTAPLTGGATPGARVVDVVGPVTHRATGTVLGWVRVTVPVPELIAAVPLRDGAVVSITDNHLPLSGPALPDDAIDHQLTLEVLGREWLLTAASPDAGPDRLLLTVGLLLTLVAMLLLDRTQRSGTRLRSDAAHASAQRDSYARLVDVVIDNVDVGIVACDVDGRTTLTNDAAAQMLGAGRTTDGAQDQVDRLLQRAIAGDAVMEEVVVICPEGPRTLCVRAHPLRLDGGGTGGAVAAIQDVTERKSAETDLMRLAMQDDLTGLANRRALSMALEASLDRQRAGGPAITLLLMDLDRFKQVNDTLGHHRGDQMLTDVSTRLRDHIHEGDVAARIGGDEFVLLCPHLGSTAEATRLAHHVLATLTPVLRLSEAAGIRSGVSIGVVRPDAGVSVDDVMRFADLAMYEAKAAEGTSVRLYRPAMDTHAADSHATEIALRLSTVDGSLRLRFQPVVDVATGAIVSAEALVRWYRDGVEQTPDAFLPIAEQSSLIAEIDLWVLREACRAAADPLMPPVVNINVSARTLERVDLVERTRAALEEFGIEPGRLGMELTETTLIGASPVMDRTVAGLVRLGVRLSLDDFGTGYASLNYLRRFPVDVIKIDREFVQGMDDSAADRGIVAGTVDLARRLGLRTVAEGVETPSQARMLVEMGCDMLQGYLLGRPMHQGELVRLGGGGSAPVREPAAT